MEAFPFRLGSLADHDCIVMPYQGSRYALIHYKSPAVGNPEIWPVAEDQGRSNLALDLSDLLEEAELPELKLKSRLVIERVSTALPSTKRRTSIQLFPTLPWGSIPRSTQRASLAPARTHAWGTLPLLFSAGNHPALASHGCARKCRSLGLQHCGCHVFCQQPLRAAIGSVTTSLQSTCQTTQAIQGVLFAIVLAPLAQVSFAQAHCRIVEERLQSKTETRNNTGRQGRKEALPKRRTRMVQQAMKKRNKERTLKFLFEQAGTSRRLAIGWDSHGGVEAEELTLPWLFVSYAGSESASTPPQRWKHNSLQLRS